MWDSATWDAGTWDAPVLVVVEGHSGRNRNRFAQELLRRRMRLQALRQAIEGEPEPQPQPQPQRTPAVSAPVRRTPPIVAATPDYSRLLARLQRMETSWARILDDEDDEVVVLL